MNTALAQEQVRAFWNGQPCDSDLSDREPMSREYFLDIERHRYHLQPHILDLMDRIDFRDKRVLEVGAGIGTDARNIIVRGGNYTGINVDPGSTAAATRALKVFGLPGQVLERNATSLDFPDASFDIVYSFGVLQHIPEVGKAISEIHRVLKPGGQIMAMVYNKSSINYAIEIMFLRKLGLHVIALPGAVPVLSKLGLPREKLERHRELRRQFRDTNHRMTDGEWLSRNTNGPDYPYCRVYDAREAAELFSRFEILANEAHFFDYRHWGFAGRMLPPRVCRALGESWGWHRIVHARKR